jgi:hypothetical protein
MKHKIIVAVAALVGLYALGVQTARAAPMMCSGEEKTCIAACQKSPLALIGDCIAGCRTRSNFCKQTGCWVNGPSRFCGLLRQ